MLIQARLKEAVHHDAESAHFTRKTGARAGKIVGSVHDPRGHLKLCLDHERLPAHAGRGSGGATGIAPRAMANPQVRRQ